MDGNVLGTDSFTVKSIVQKGDRQVYSCTTKLELTGRTTSGEWAVDDRGRPEMYRLEGNVGAVEYTIHCAFSDDKVVEKAVQAGQPIERTVPLTDRVYLIDNNNMSLFAFLMAAVPRVDGQAVSFKVFHPTSMQVLPVQFTVSGKEPITLNGKQYDAWVFDGALAGARIKMWVDEQGRLLRDEEAGGRMIIELIED